MKHRTLFLSIGLLFLLNSTIQACSCYSGALVYPLYEMDLLLSTPENYRKPLVFNGRLINMKINDLDVQTPKAVLLFEVLQYYVGVDKDTIEVVTNLYSEACGFTSPLNSNAIIFARKTKDGTYITSRSDCCKSTSEQYEKARYDAFEQFFEVLIHGKDGEYAFKNVFHRFSQFYVSDSIRSQEVLHFSIKNGQLDGTWKVTDNRGKLIEQGFFKQGKRHGKWLVISNDKKRINDKKILKELYFENGEQIKKKKDKE